MPRKNNPKQTIENIICISAKLFVTKGYDKTSMQDIIDALGMSRGAIFYHFSSKEDIFNAVMEKQFERVIETVNLWLAQMKGLTAKEKLRGVLKCNFTDEKVIKEANHIITGAIGNPHLVLAFTQNNVNKLAPIFANILREGIDDKSITTEFPDECAEVFLLLINFWCDPDIFQGDSHTVCKRLRFLQHMLRQLGADILEDEVINFMQHALECGPQNHAGQAPSCVKTD